MGLFGSVQCLFSDNTSDDSPERERVGLPSSTRRWVRRWIVYDHQHAQIDTKRWHGRASNATCAAHVDQHILSLSSFTRSISLIIAARLASSACWNTFFHRSIHTVLCVIHTDPSPQEMQERTTNVKGKGPEKNKDAETKERSTNTGVWPPETGVHRVTWNNGNGLAGASLLASATASGLCRVDWLTGRWIKDRTPYVSVPKMRKEVEGASDESVEEA